MSTALFQSVHHVAVICSDYARSKNFYVERLGFRVLRETYRRERDSYKLDLEINAGCQLELFSFPGPPPPRPSRPEACGLRHLAFAVPDVAAMVRTLAARQVEAEPVRTDGATGCKFTFFQDPDGLPIEIYEQARR